MINVGVAGRFKLEAVNEETGERRELAPWFDNLITDLGLNHLGTSGIGQFCLVGTGTAAPAVTDTGLGNKLAHTTTNAGITYGVVTSPNYSWVRVIFRFAAGTATGNLSEIGVGISTTQVFSRTLIKDAGGNPTTITVLASEALDVTYELRLYPPSADVPHSTVIAGVTYTGVVRPRLITAGASSGDVWSVRAFGVPVSFNGPSPAVNVFSGTIGANTGGPSGTQANISGSIAEAAYSQNSLVRSGTVTCPLSECNVPGGIQAVGVNTTMGSYQISFTPAIPKDATKVLTLGFTLAWNRMVI